MKAKNKKKLTEVEIATVIQHYFSSKNWDLFPEVVISIFDGRPDFVGKKGDLCAAIECKTSLTYPVLEQLIRWPLSYQEKVDSEYQDASTSGIPHLLFAVTVETSGTYSFLRENCLTITVLAISKYAMKELHLARMITPTVNFALMDMRISMVKDGESSLAPKLKFSRAAGRQQRTSLRC